MLLLILCVFDGMWPVNEADKANVVWKNSAFTGQPSVNAMFHVGIKGKALNILTTGINL